ncbi:hypothetical protein DMI65_12945 [Escherichia coli]|nr:hypothetical protein [Escherichia coli]
MASVKKLARVLVDVNKARTMSQRLKLSRLRLRDLMPVPPAVANTPLDYGWGHRRANGENLRHHLRTARCTGARSHQRAAQAWWVNSKKR